MAVLILSRDHLSRNREVESTGFMSQPLQNLCDLFVAKVAVEHFHNRGEASDWRHRRATFGEHLQGFVYRSR